MINSADSKRKLLVFGSGFIAAELANTAARQWGWQVEVIYRNYQNPSLSELPCHLFPTSSQGLRELIDAIAPTDVVIALGSSFVPEINRDINRALEQHLDGGLMILDILSRQQKQITGKVLVIGSASEYGEFSDRPISESCESHPRDHYGLIKLSLQHVGQHYHRAHGLPVIHVRQFNATGAQQSSRFVLPSICAQIARLANQADLGQPNRIVAGNTAVRRDFLSVHDVCHAYRTLLLYGTPGETYNVCSGQAYKISELIALAANIANLQLEIDINPALIRENDNVQAVICGDPTKLKKLGWEQKVSMRELLLQMIHFYSTATEMSQSPITKKEA